MPEGRCWKCGREPQKEAVKPEPDIDHIAYRWRCIMVGWNWDDSLDGEHFDQIEKALKGALTEYADALKER